MNPTLKLYEIHPSKPLENGNRISKDFIAAERHQSKLPQILIFIFFYLMQKNVKMGER